MYTYTVIKGKKKKKQQIIFIVLLPDQGASQSGTYAVLESYSCDNNTRQVAAYPLRLQEKL